jgi:hypothetical protein
LIAVKGGLGRVAEAAWASTGYSVVRLRGAINPVPSWAVIEAREPGRGPLLSVSTSANGTFEMVLPEGKYQISANTPGGVDTASISVSSKTYQATLEMFSPETGKLLYRVADEGGHLIPARLIVRGVYPTKTPVFGPPYAARGAANILYTATGTGEVELAPGQYRIAITRGIEYELVRREVLVNEGQGAVVRATLKKALNTSGWRAADLHLHAAPSYDSQVSIEDRVISLLAEGVRFAAATDHNAITDYTDAIARLGASDKLIAASGVEVTTAEPFWGHFNVWPIATDRMPPPFVGINPISLFEHIRQENPGALIQVNHPWMKELQIGYFDIAELDSKNGIWQRPGYSPGYDVVEVVNGFELGNAGRIESNIRYWLNLLNLERHYPATGGSDAHRLVGQIAGYPRTYLRIPENVASSAIVNEAAAAVTAGRTLITTGPFIRMRVGGGEPGDVVSAVNGSVDIEVSVSAASWIDVDRLEIISNGQSVITSAVQAAPDKIERSRLVLHLPVSRDCWVVAIARGSKALDDVLPYVGALPFAFTNPVYVDTDADGVYTAPPRSD